MNRPKYIVTQNLNRIKKNVRQQTAYNTQNIHNRPELEFIVMTGTKQKADPLTDGQPASLLAN